MTKITQHLSLAATLAAMAIAPTAAVASPGQSGAHRPAADPAVSSDTSTTVAPAATDPSTACKGLSKKHVAGTKGTPFSQCVVALAKVASGKAANPTSACKGLSKKHVAGTKGTPFSQCVSAAAKLLEQQSGGADDDAPGADDAPAVAATTDGSSTDGGTPTA